MANQNQIQTPHKNPTQIPIEQIMRQIIDMLKLDAKTATYVRERLNDDRFTINTEGEEIIMTIGPVECDTEGYVDIALTVAEAIALAIRLIQHAINLSTTQAMTVVEVVL
jgi:hypothetical protein